MHEYRCTSKLEINLYISELKRQSHTWTPHRSIYLPTTFKCAWASIINQPNEKDTCHDVPNYSICTHTPHGRDHPCRHACIDRWIAPARMHAWTWTSERDANASWMIEGAPAQCPDRAACLQWAMEHAHAAKGMQALKNFSNKMS